MGEVDAVVGCTHSEDIQLTAGNIELIRRPGEKLLVIDVAKPENFPKNEYEFCRRVVVRQDAGNAYSSRLKYVLGAISYRMFRLTRGVTFGCFAEALALAAALKRGEEWVRDINWLVVNDENMAMVDKLFKHDGFKMPQPTCFSRPVTSFDLTLGQNNGQAAHPSQLKLVLRKMHIL